MTGPQDQSPLQGKAWRDAVRRLQSAQAHARRIRSQSYTPKSRKPPGESYRPGMARRMPPPLDSTETRQP